MLVIHSDLSSSLSPISPISRGLILLPLALQTPYFCNPPSNVPTLVTSPIFTPFPPSLQLFTPFPRSLAPSLPPLSLCLCFSLFLTFSLSLFLSFSFSFANSSPANESLVSLRLCTRSNKSCHSWAYYIGRPLKAFTNPVGPRVCPI